jgi:hypothetical protein
MMIFYGRQIYGAAGDGALGLVSRGSKQPHPLSAYLTPLLEKTRQMQATAAIRSRGLLLGDMERTHDHASGAEPGHRRHLRCAPTPIPRSRAAS